MILLLCIRNFFIKILTITALTQYTGEITNMLSLSSIISSDSMGIRDSISSLSYIENREIISISFHIILSWYKSSLCRDASQIVSKSIILSIWHISYFLLIEFRLFHNQIFNKVLPLRLNLDLLDISTTFLFQCFIPQAAHIEGPHPQKNTFKSRHARYSHSNIRN